MSFAFAGTPRFASWVLSELFSLGRVPVLVISQPDRRRGRGLSQGVPAAVEQGACLGLDCVQTGDINSTETIARLQALGVQTLAVASFGQVLREPLLSSVTCVNVHASLLPKYRGAAPIERALMAGETSTGVSIMRITEGLDEGPWAQQVKVSIGPRQDAGSLSRVLAVAGAAALADVLASIEDGTVSWTSQQGSPVYAHKLTADDCWLDVAGDAQHAHDQVRALSPEVGARASLGDSEVKIWRSWPYEETGASALPRAAVSVLGRQGSIATADGRLFLGCRRGVLEVLDIQPACRARMTAAEFLRGHGRRMGTQLRDQPAG